MSKTKHDKISFIISIFSVTICLVAVVVSVINLNYVTGDNMKSGTDITLFWCTISILFANIAICISSYTKYKKHVK